MKIETYSGKYDDEIIDLILGIQNNESKIDLSLEEQPDLKDIERFYQPAYGFLPCLQQNYARKSAHISYEDMF